MHIRGRHKEGEGVNNRDVTTYSIDYMYVTEEGKETQRKTRPEEAIR